ncbi:MAG: DUF2933 domain-containing protein [Lachnospiraceae bacterium]|nr:DUF2933 domain-containing protein [Lachnospiraceae bacterium]
MLFTALQLLIQYFISACKLFILICPISHISHHESHDDEHDHNQICCHFVESLCFF